MPGMTTHAWTTYRLEVQLARRQPEELILKLFTNERTPQPTDTAARYTEVQGPGYAAVRLDPREWTIDDARSNRPAIARYPEVVFMFQGPTNRPIAGYFIVTKDTVLLVGGEQFTTLDKATGLLVPAPRTVEHIGDLEKITIVLTQR